MSKFGRHFDHAEQARRAKTFEQARLAEGAVKPVLPIPTPVPTRKLMTGPLPTTTLTYKMHAGSIEIDLQEKVIRGRILGIKDSVTYQADDLHSLQASFEKAVEGYLSTMMLDCAGREIKLGDRVATTVYSKGKTSSTLFVGTVLRFSKLKVETSLDTVPGLLVGKSVMKFPRQLAVLK